MKILHVCGNYYPAFGGPQYTMNHLSEKLISYYGDEVEVATSNSLFGPEMPLFKKIEPSEEIINGVNIKRFSFNRWHFPILNFGNKLSGKVRRKRLPYYLMKYKWELDCRGIDKRMQYTDADVIMASTINYMFCDYPLWRFKTKNPKPFILYGSLHLHINWSKNSPFIKRARICNCYISNTEYERQRLIDYGIKENKVVTIGTGIDIEDFTNEPESVQEFRDKYDVGDDDILIGHIGRLSEGKGAGLLLDAFIQLRQKNNKYKLLLAGTFTDYVAELKQKGKKHKVPIIIIENFENSLKPIIFNAIDIFVLASKGESFGVVFLEAWACKKPVIGARTPAIASLLDEDVNSYTFEPGNALSLANKLQLMLNDPNKGALLGENGYKKVQTLFTWKIIVEKYKAAYIKGIENFKRVNGNFRGAIW